MIYSAYYTTEKKPKEQAGWIKISRETARTVQKKIIGTRLRTGIDGLIRDERRLKDYLKDAGVIQIETDPDNKDRIRDIGIHHEEESGLIKLIKYLKLPYIPGENENSRE